mgnify:CR=1 FL=1
MKRFQVVTYSDDIGTDEHMDFDGLQSAIKEAKKYRKREQYAAIYDNFFKIAIVVFGNPATPVFTDNIKIVTLR